MVNEFSQQLYAVGQEMAAVQKLELPQEIARGYGAAIGKLDALKQVAKDSYTQQVAEAEIICPKVDLSMIDVFEGAIPGLEAMNDRLSSGQYDEEEMNTVLESIKGTLDTVLDPVLSCPYNKNEPLCEIAKYNHGNITNERNSSMQVIEKLTSSAYHGVVQNSAITPLYEAPNGEQQEAVPRVFDFLLGRRTRQRSPESPQYTVFIKDASGSISKYNLDLASNNLGELELSGAEAAAINLNEIDSLKQDDKKVLFVDVPVEGLSHEEIARYVGRDLYPQNEGNITPFGVLEGLEGALDLPGVGISMRVMRSPFGMHHQE